MSWLSLNCTKISCSDDNVQEILCAFNYVLRPGNNYKVIRILSVTPFYSSLNVALTKIKLSIVYQSSVYIFDFAEAIVPKEIMQFKKSIRLKAKNIIKYYFLHITTRIYLTTSCIVMENIQKYLSRHKNFQVSLTILHHYP